MLDGVSAETLSSPASSAAGDRKRAYPAPASLPTQAASLGIQFDFNEGARLALPRREAGKWRVLMRDLSTGNVLFQTENQGAVVRSSKRWFVRFCLEVWDVTDDAVAIQVLKHEYDARDRAVTIQFPIGTLGDVLAWFPAAERFRQAHGCVLTCVMSPLIYGLLRQSYPEINFLSQQEFVQTGLADTCYATYYMGLFFDDLEFNYQPTDFRQVGLHRTAAHILGVDTSEDAPRLTLPDDSRPINEPYVCISVQASTQSKCWNNPTGWSGVIRFLKDRGYRVVCIDQKPVTGGGIVWNHIPHGVEDETGDRPLAERARWLRHAAAFIGLSSGLAWLAWAAGAPVVMISGFTHPTNEFSTPYRIINWHACNSCWNDVRLRFDHTDRLWCPRHGGTPRQFECTRLITTEQVINVLKRVITITDISTSPGELHP